MRLKAFCVGISLLGLLGSHSIAATSNNSDGDANGETTLELFVACETSFPLLLLRLLASALDDAWARIEKAGSRFARPAYSRVMREVVAKRIIEMAQRGVTDQEKLAADAVRFISTNYVENYSARIESRKELAV